MPRSSSGFTRIDLLVVIVAVAMCIFVTVKIIDHHRARTARIKCIGSLKNASLALKIFAINHLDKYPYQIEPSLRITTPQTSIELNNPTISDVRSNAVWAHWGTISNELGSPKVLICSGNSAKHNSIASDFTTTMGRGYFAEGGWRQMGKVDHGMDRIDYDRQVGYDISGSYFINLNAEEKTPAAIQMGDANINWTGPEAGTRLNPARAGLQILDQPDHFTDFRFVRGRDHPRYYDHHDGAGNVALCCHFAVENQPPFRGSKPATPRWLIHSIWERMFKGIAGEFERAGTELRVSSSRSRWSGFKPVCAGWFWISQVGLAVSL